ncbi:hypothetical protein V8G54_007905, partial [Vigna mungo]
KKKRDDQALKIQHVFGEGKKKPSKWKGKNKDQKKWKKETEDQEEKGDSADKKNVVRKQYTKEEKKNMECFVCRKKGHLSCECWFNKDTQNKKGRNKEAHIAEEEDSESEPLILMVATNTENSETTKEVWYVNSGCSNHMTYNKSWLTNLDESKKSKVRVADNSTLKVEGIGNVRIKSRNGMHATLENVLLVPEMKCSLISVGQLNENGYTVIMGSNAQMEVYDRGKNLILKCLRSGNRTFQVHLDVIKTLQCLATTKEDENSRWHLRFGHLNYRDLKKLNDKELVKGLPRISPQHKDCESCILGKQTRKPFRKQLESRSKERLEIVHSDVCGPIEPPTIAGNRYFLTFVEEYSRMIWVFLLRQKNEALEVFKSYKKQVEKEIERQIKLLRIDGGGEYTSHEFEEFCREHGIVHEVIAPYTPQHNGLAERQNRTIVNMARCMLREKDVSRELWGEAVVTSVHILNRCPTKGLTDKVPHAAWTGMTSSVKYFKVFGSLAFTHVADQKRVKLDDKSEPMVFVGYHSTGAYKLFDPIKRIMKISRDVIVIEDEHWD